MRRWHLFPCTSESFIFNSSAPAPFFSPRFAVLVLWLLTICLVPTLEALQLYHTHMGGLPPATPHVCLPFATSGNTSLTLFSDIPAAPQAIQFFFECPSFVGLSVFLRFPLRELHAFFLCVFPLLFLSSARLETSEVDFRVSLFPPRCMRAFCTCALSSTTLRGASALPLLFLIVHLSNLFFLVESAAFSVIFICVLLTHSSTLPFPHLPLLFIV